MREITIEELKKKLDSADIQLIDIRPSAIFEEGHVNIPSIKNIPFRELPHHLQELKKKETVYILCSHGNSSLLAATFLEEEGFDTVSVIGGTEAWKEKYLKRTYSKK